MNKMLIAAFACINLAAIQNAAAQTWTGTTVPTYTNENTSIGIAAATSSAKLHLYNQEYYYAAPGFNIPSLLIKRDIIGDGRIPFGYTPANLIEAWTERFTGMGVSQGPQKMKMVLTNEGYLGLNDQYPTHRLTLRDGDFAMPRTNDQEVRHITALSDRGMLYISTNPADGHPLIQMGANNNGWRAGQIWYHSASQQGYPAQMFVDWSHKLNNWVGIMRLAEDNGIGKVTIGDCSDLPGSGKYSLYVERGILTERVKVAIKTSSDWSDYVFADDYQLKPLEEVAAFIQENKHLPDVPSAEEVVKDGIDVGEMDAKLLQKIEELTLYSIEQQKLLKAQQQQLQAQQKAIEKLEQMVKQ